MVMKPSSVVETSHMLVLLRYHHLAYLINLYCNSECVIVNEMSVRKMLKVSPALERSNSHHIPIASATRVTDNSM